MRTWGEDHHLQAQEGGLRRNQPCQHLDLRLLASRMVRKYISLFKPPGLWYGSPRKLTGRGFLERKALLSLPERLGQAAPRLPYRAAERLQCDDACEFD